MKLSFSTLGCPGYNMDQVIEMAIRNGYQGVELRAVEGKIELWTLPSFSGGGLKETAKKLRENNLEISCIGTSVSYSRRRDECFNSNAETIKRYIELACVLECKYIRVFGGPLVPVLGYLNSIKQIREGFALLSETANANGIIPLLETHDDFSTSARVMDILDGIPLGKFGVLWDVLHTYRYGEPIADTYSVLKDRIRHIHVKDGKNLSAGDSDLVLTGAGDMPIGDCVKVLRDGGYKGFYSLEWEKMWHPEIEEPEVAIPQYAEYMKSLM